MTLTRKDFTRLFKTDRPKVRQLFEDSVRVAVEDLGLGGGGVTIGSPAQIPFVNGAGDDFAYDNDFTFDGTVLQVTTVSAGELTSPVADLVITADDGGQDILIYTGATSTVDFGPDNEIIVGAPTGGGQGAGSINAEAIFINGAPVGGGAGPTSGDAITVVGSEVNWGGSFDSDVTLFNSNNAAIQKALVYQHTNANAALVISQLIEEHSADVDALGDPRASYSRQSVIAVNPDPSGADPLGRTDVYMYGTFYSVTSSGGRNLDGSGGGVSSALELDRLTATLAGEDNVELDSIADGAVLANAPTGAVSLAIATTGYVNSNFVSASGQTVYNFSNPPDGADFTMFDGQTNTLNLTDMTDSFDFTLFGFNIDPGNPKDKTPTGPNVAYIFDFFNVDQSDTAFRVDINGNMEINSQLAINNGRVVLDTQGLYLNTVANADLRIKGNANGFEFFDSLGGTGYADIRSDGGFWNTGPTGQISIGPWLDVFGFNDTQPGVRVSEELEIERISRGGDPATTITNGFVLTQSDGSGFGDNGDIILTLRLGGVTKQVVIADWSAL